MRGNNSTGSTTDTAGAVGASGSGSRVPAPSVRPHTTGELSGHGHGHGQATVPQPHTHHRRSRKGKHHHNAAGVGGYLQQLQELRDRLQAQTEAEHGRFDVFSGSPDDGEFRVLDSSVGGAVSAESAEAERWLASRAAQGQGQAPDGWPRFWAEKATFTPPTHVSSSSSGSSSGSSTAAMLFVRCRTTSTPSRGTSSSSSGEQQSQKKEKKAKRAPKVCVLLSEQLCFQRRITAHP